MARRTETKYIPHPGEFGVCRRREVAGYSTQEQFAEECGVSESMVARAEKCEPTTRGMLTKMASRLGCRWEEMLDPTAAANADVLMSIKMTFHRLWPEFTRWEQSRSALLPLHVDSLAIDLTDGWELIHHTINNMDSNSVRFRIMMLAGPSDAMPGSGYSLDGPEFRKTIEWSKFAVIKLDDMRLRAAAGELCRPGKSVELEIRTCRTVPVEHGIIATKGNVQLLAFTKCGIQEGVLPDYVQGLADYRMAAIEHGPDGIALDAAGRFVDKFDSMWVDAASSVALPATHM